MIGAYPRCCPVSCSRARTAERRRTARRAEEPDRRGLELVDGRGRLVAVDGRHGVAQYLVYRGTVQVAATDETTFATRAGCVHPVLLRGRRRRHGGPAVRALAGGLRHDRDPPRARGHKDRNGLGDGHLLAAGSTAGRLPGHVRGRLVGGR